MKKIVLLVSLTFLVSCAKNGDSESDSDSDSGAVTEEEIRNFSPAEVTAHAERVFGFLNNLSECSEDLKKGPLDGKFWIADNGINQDLCTSIGFTRDLVNEETGLYEFDEVDALVLWLRVLQDLQNDNLCRWSAHKARVWVCTIP